VTDKLMKETAMFTETRQSTVGHVPPIILTWKRAVAAAIGGIIGTIVFDVLGLLFGMPWWDVPRMLGGAVGVGLAGGVVMHYVNGMILAIIFAGLLPLFFGPVWVRAIQFITLQTIFGVWLFMMPLAGMGPLGLEHEAGIMMPIGSLIRHWAYAVVVGLLYPVLVTRIDPVQRRTEV
jgi:hypothetical protein